MSRFFGTDQAQAAADQEESHIKQKRIQEQEDPSGAIAVTDSGADASGAEGSDD